ncbi:MAG: nucleotidyltransferase domain-containing protein [Oscillospiraceae bacterium]|nr:nucleotidyltransferase domain-containing protein [Oscillospiraceae bacterium]
MLDKKTVITAANRYADEVRKEYAPYAIVIFGSYVNGNPHEDSDIDIAVVFNGFNGDWLKTSANLWKLTRSVTTDIEPHLLDTANDKSGFADYVLRTGNIIYKA